MNAFEKILVGLVAAAPATAPVFVHSAEGMAVVNASEVLLASILAQFQKPEAAPPSTTATETVSSN